jgi:hypothetical protein
MQIPTALEEFLDTCIPPIRRISFKLWKFGHQVDGALIAQFTLYLIDWRAALGRVHEAAGDQSCRPQSPNHEIDDWPKEH